MLDHPRTRMGGQILQFVLAIVFVVLYVLGTYAPPAPDSLRARADLLLCALFAAEYVHRMLVSAGAGHAAVQAWVG